MKFSPERDSHEFGWILGQDDNVDGRIAFLERGSRGCLCRHELPEDLDCNGMDASLGADVSGGELSGSDIKTSSWKYTAKNEYLVSC